MPKPSERAKALTATATDGEGLSKEVVARIAHVMGGAIEEGRKTGLREAATKAYSEAIYLRDHLDDSHKAAGAYRAGQRIEELLEPELAPTEDG